MASVLCEIGLFGGLRVIGRRPEGGDDPQEAAPALSRARPRNADVLLARLAYAAGSPVPRETLADMLWPDARSTAQSLQRLSVELNRLRDIFLAAGVDPDAVIAADRDAVALRPEAVRVDVTVFDDLRRRAARAGTDPTERLRALTEAADLYRGPLLPAFSAEWVTAGRERLADAYLSTVEETVSLLETAGERDRAAEVATRAANIEPHREDAHRLVMRLLLDAGRPEAVLRRYEALERLLETLGDEPSDPTRRLAAEARSRLQSPRPAATPAPAPAPPAPKAAAALPAYFYRLIGRDADRERLAELLLSPDVRLVTLTGPGGCGKTRLSVETARRVAPGFDGAVWFVPLAGVTDPRQVAEHVARALNVARTAGRDAADEVTESLGERAALLVLDNYEQLAAQGRGVVRGLLERSPGLTCLVTSRQRLDLTGEREWELRPLPTPGAGSPADHVGRCPSVELFVEQARGRRSDFALGPKNAAAVAALCDRLDGLPLAIELAASWSPVLAPAQMLGRLDQILVSRDGDRPEQHRSLTAALDVSYQLLGADLRAFLEALSVFRGGWTLEAAEAVCEAGNLSALDALERLRAASLILAEEQRRTGEMRYRMLETLRAYAAARLRESGHEAAARERHRAYFIGFAREASAGLHGWEQAGWLERLEADHANLHDALVASDVETRVRAAAGLRRFWEVRGHLDEGRSHLAPALDDTSPLALDARRQALLELGNLDFLIEEYARAQHHFETGLRLAPPEREKAAFLLGRAGALVLQKRMEEATNTANEAYAAASAAFGADAPQLDEYHNMLGFILKVEGRWEEARKHYGRALSLAEREFDTEPDLVSKYLTNLGALTEQVGEPMEALTYLLRAIRIDRRVLGRRHPRAAIQHNNIGRVWAKRSEWEKAARHHRTALCIFLETYPSAHINVGMSLFYLANAERALDRGAVAISRYREALPILEKHFGLDHPYCLTVRNIIGE